MRPSGYSDSDTGHIVPDGVTIDLPAQVNKILDEGVVIVPRNLAVVRRKS